MTKLQETVIYIVAGLAITVGIIFRTTSEVNTLPLWIEEISFVNFVNNGQIHLNQLLPMLQHMMIIRPGVEDLTIRLPHIIIGLFMIPVAYLTLKNRSYSIMLAAVIAIFPLFIFWSGLALPYATAGLFILLAYRYPVFFPLALLSTPAAIFGLKMSKDIFKDTKKLILYTTYFIYAATVFVATMNVKEMLNFNYLLSSANLYFIPLLSLFLHLFDYFSKKKMLSLSFAVMSLMIFFSSTLVIKQGHAWYQGNTGFPDWQGKICNYSTNEVAYEYYNPSYKADWFRLKNLRNYGFEKIKDHSLSPNSNRYLWISRKLIRSIATDGPQVVAFDYNALSSGIALEMIPLKILKKEELNLLNDNVIRYKVSLLNNNKIYWQKLTEGE